MVAAQKWQNRIVDSGIEDADQLLAHPFNARIHPHFQQQALEGVLDSIGWVQRVIVNRATGHVVDGHLRVALAITRGEQVPVDYVDLTEHEEKAILASFDYITTLAAYDKDQLDTLLQQVNSDDARVQELLSKLAEDVGLYKEPPAAPDAQVARAAELQQKWLCERGQLWEIGKHRLLCGDSTNADDVARVMDRERAEITLTDPPYNVGIDYGKTTDDKRDNYPKWSEQWFNLAQTHSNNIAFSCGHPNIIMWAKIAAWKWIICWHKPGAMLGSPFGFSNWEPVLFYGTTKSRGTDVINAPIIVREEMNGHPVPKQPEWAIKLLELLTERGQITYDPFGGSGTTMVACEQLGRQCRMIEIEPKYCAVILERMSAMGLTPRLVE